MNQDRLFRNGEGDRWFARNHEYLSQAAFFDWPCELFRRLVEMQTIRSVAELGCADGWRLRRLARDHGPFNRLAGIDASAEAIETGRKADPSLDLKQALLQETAFTESFDCVIVNFVFHWVDRASLARSLAETDRLVHDGGFLIVGDFAPDHPSRRAYHHLPAGQAYTYKQDYTAMFLALGTYREICRIHYNQDVPAHPLLPLEGDNRAECALLQKSLKAFYEEVRP